MQEQLSRRYQQIIEFTHEAINRKYAPYKALKDAHTTCRTYVEKKIARDAVIQRIISADTPQPFLIKELIINYTLLKMHNHAVLWEIETHKLEA